MSSQKGRGHQDDANVAKYSESSAVSDTKAVVEGIKSYQAGIAETQARLKRMQEMLRSFTAKEKANKESWADDGWARLRTVPARTSSKPRQPCLLLEILTEDALRKLAAVLPGRKLLQFACVSRGCNDAAIDLDVWKRKIISELPVEVEQRDLPSSGRAARRLFQQWLRQFHQVLATFEWLASVGYPCDISGTKGGVPLERRVTSALENTVSLTKSGRLKADALVVLREHGLRAMLALVQSAKQNMQERAACAMANLLASDDAGRAFVQKFRALEPVRAMLSGHHLGLQKQASRLMVNAWIAPSQRVLAGCPFEALSQPFRTKVPVHSWRLPPGVQPSPAEERPAGATEWMLIECSPAGEPQALQQLWMFTDSAGLLVAQGVDELGAYVLSAASDRSKLTYNGWSRRVQWANGPSLEYGETRRSSDSGWNPYLDFSPLPSAAAASASEPLLCDNASSGKGAGASQLKRGQSAGAFAAGCVQRGVVEVTDGIEHLVLLKTYGSACGTDHVKFIAFPDALGLWGVWERARFRYHHKIDGGSKGCFRMWQVSD